MPLNHVAIGDLARFQDWFPYFRNQFRSISTGICNATLSAYLDDHLNLNTRTCYLHIDCILDHTRESTKAHLSSSVVILGLTPTILSSLGTSLSEASLLSSRRPILALLCSLGAPSLNSTRFLDMEDPIESLTDRNGRLIVDPVPSLWAAVISAIEYLLAAAAVANVVQTSYDLGNKTIVTWKCNVSFLPLMWTLAPGLIHLLAVLPFHLSAAGRTMRSVDMGSIKESERKRYAVVRWWKRETQISANRPRPPVETVPTMRSTARTFGTIAQLLSLIHLIFGTLVFSSLLFISVIDSLPVIVQYAVSAFIFRSIVMFELAGMKRARAGPQMLAGEGVELTDGLLAG